MNIENIVIKVLEGKRICDKEALFLYQSNELHQIGSVADIVNKRINKGYAYFILNQHINPTNICINRCKFCAFSRSKGEKGAFELTIEDILNKIRNNANFITEVHIVGGLHPNWKFDYYTEILRQIKKNFPHIKIKAFTAVEIEYFSRISGKSIKDVIITLKENGLEVIPGGGAEILCKGIRNKLCPEKISGKKWLEIHKTAHLLGIKTNATMLYGHIESLKDRVEHMMMIRDLQDETGGFQVFIPLSYHSLNTEIGGKPPSGIDDLMTIAISRIVFDNIPHIKAYWIMLGEKLSQVALLYGADDLEGTVIEEKITHSAGANTSEKLTKEEFIYLIKKAGKIPVERDSTYNIIKLYE